MGEKTKTVRINLPWVMTLVVLGVLVVLQVIAHYWTGFFINQLDNISYDWRVQIASKHSPPLSTNLAVVAVDELTRDWLGKGELKEGTTGTVFRADWPYPRHLHGRIVRELKAQGAHAVAFDVMFAERHPDNPAVPMPLADASKLGFSPAEIEKLTPIPYSPIVPQKQPDTPEMNKVPDIPGVSVESDEFFAIANRQAGNVILAANSAENVVPDLLFRTNAAGIADISSFPDGDGILRRFKPFTDIPIWEPTLKQVVENEGFLTSNYDIQTNQIVFTHVEAGKTNRLVVPIGQNGNYCLKDFYRVDLQPLSADQRQAAEAMLARRAKPYTMQRVWNMGIVLGAQFLGLDLDRAQADPAGKLILPGTNGVNRVLPIDRQGFVLVDWKTDLREANLTKMSYGLVLQFDAIRNSTNASLVFSNVLQQLKKDGLLSLPDEKPLKGKLVVIGSMLSGSNVRDQGPTPLGASTLYVSCHWNVADSLIRGRFIRQFPLPVLLLLIILPALVSAWLTYNLRALAAFSSVMAYTWLRWRLPMAMPVLGGLLMTHVCTITHRVLMEQKERRRIKSIFEKVVSPNVVDELLSAESLALGGARREVTVLFSDVRGFTEMTDQSQARADDYVRERNLSNREAAEVYDEQAREVLATVNLFLTTVVGHVINNRGTFDKYIGDCVMAFWGAPTSNPRHAVDAVRAAIAAQRAMHRLNLDREAENQRRQQENTVRVAKGQPPLPSLAVLSLGTGINTGTVTAGLMGSDQTQVNYTVFGREVNLASRLEGVSGRGRIIISATTFASLQAENPELASSCVPLVPVHVKGFLKPVPVYEVPWREEAAPPLPAPAAGETVPPAKT
jgi:class 3 adenylate cyclase/CHASE2 domain-containing sensor protein